MTIEELNNVEEYEKILELEHNHLIPFIQGQYQQKTNVLRWYIGLNIGLLLLIVLLAIVEISGGYLYFSKLLFYFSIGVVLSFSLLVVVHEWIHGLAYQWMGASKITYGGDLRKFYFYAAADQFVVNRIQLFTIALAPFVFISSACLIGLALSDIQYSWIFLGILLSHTAMCGGDFGMINYFQLHPELDIYTYDDIERKVSYFFVKKNGPA